MVFQNYSQNIPWTGPVSGKEYTAAYATWEYVHVDDFNKIRADFGTQYLTPGF